MKTSLNGNHQTAMTDGPINGACFTGLLEDIIFNSLVESHDINPNIISGKF